MVWTPRQSRMLLTAGQGAPTVAIAGVRRTVRSVQPQVSVGINYGNPINKGLVDAGLPFNSRTVGGTPVTVSGTSQTLAVGPAGIAVNNASGGTGYWRYSNPALSPPNNSPFTLVTLYRLTATGTAGRVISNLTSGFAGYGLLPTTTNFRAAIANIGGNMLFSGNAVSTAVQCDAILYTGTQGKYYQKGVQVGVAQTGNYDVMLDKFQIGADGGGAAAAPSQVFMWAFYNRALSDTEIASLSQNPYQIFLPDTQKVWVAA